MASLGRETKRSQGLPPTSLGSCHEDRILFVSYDMVLLLSKCPDPLTAFLPQHREWWDNKPVPLGSTWGIFWYRWVVVVVSVLWSSIRTSGRWCLFELVTYWCCLLCLLFRVTEVLTLAVYFSCASSRFSQVSPLCFIFLFLDACSFRTQVFSENWVPCF